MKKRIINLFMLAITTIILLNPNIFAAASFEVIIPTNNQKIVLPNITVKGKVTPGLALSGKINWETTIESNKFITETNSYFQGTITVLPFPTSNSSFGLNTIKATAEIDITLPEIKNLRPVPGFKTLLRVMNIGADFEDPIVNNYASGINVSTVTIFFDGNDITSAIPTLTETGFSYNLSGLPYGVHTVILTTNYVETVLAGIA